MAGPAPSRIRRARVTTESSFAADMSGSLGSFLDVALREGSSFNPQRETLRVDRTRQRMYQEVQRVLGPRSAEASIETHLAPTGTALDSSAAAPPSTPGFALGHLLRAALGGYRADRGDIESGANASTASLVYVSTDATRWEQGTIVGVLVNGRLEARRVRSVSGTNDTVAPSIDFTAAPTDGSEVYNSHVFYMADDPQYTLQLVLEEEDRDNVWWARGCSAGLQFGTGLAELLAATFQLKAATYQHDDEVSSPAGGSALAAASYTDGSPIPFTTGHVILRAGSATAGVECHALSVGIELSWGFEPIRSPAGTETIRRWRLMPGDDYPVKLSLTLPSEQGLLAVGEGTAKTVESWLRNRTRVEALVQVGDTPGSTVVIALTDQLQVLDVEPADEGGLHAIKVSLGGGETSWGSNTEIGRSPIVVGLL